MKFIQNWFLRYLFFVDCYHSNAIKDLNLQRFLHLKLREITQLPYNLLLVTGKNHNCVHIFNSKKNDLKFISFLIH